MLDGALRAGALRATVEEAFKGVAEEDAWDVWLNRALDSTWEEFRSRALGEGAVCMDMEDIVALSMEVSQASRTSVQEEGVAT